VATAAEAAGVSARRRSPPAGPRASSGSSRARCGPPSRGSAADGSAAQASPAGNDHGPTARSRPAVFAR
jgi:hypothetical protein